VVAVVAVVGSPVYMLEQMEQQETVLLLLLEEQQVLVVAVEAQLVQDLQGERVACMVLAVEMVVQVKEMEPKVL
jgi:hypothetical protein